MEPEDAEKEFEFYMKLAKPFVLNLSDAKERVKAAYWLQLLRSVTNPDSQRLRCDYLKLLLFVLQRHRLIGIFAEPPDSDEELRPFPDDLTVLGMAKRMIEEDNNAKATPPSECGDPGRYMVSISPSLQEYAVVQEIHKFGAHCYFAVSGDPITEWENSEKGYFKKKPDHLEQSFFDTTAPSMFFLDINASTAGVAEKLDRPLTPKSNKSTTVIDDSSWLEKEGSKSAVDADFDPMEGKVEIEKHFCSMNRTLKQLKNHTFLSGGDPATLGQATPSTANEFNRAVNDLFGGKFRGTIATNKLVRKIDNRDEYGTQMTRSEIIQGHTLVEQDPYDNSINQLHKSMGIQDKSSTKVNLGGGGGTSSDSESSLQYEKANFDKFIQKRLDVSLPSLSKKSIPGKSSNAISKSMPRERRTLTRHLEPSPGESIDVVTTDDGPTSITSYRHTGPGIDDTVDIITTTTPRAHGQSRKSSGKSSGTSSNKYKGSGSKVESTPKEHLSFTNREPMQRLPVEYNSTVYDDFDQNYGELNEEFIEDDNCIRSHYEPNPGEFIDIVLNDDGPSSTASYHRTAPGLDEIINIISTNPDRPYDSSGNSLDRGRSSPNYSNRAEVLKKRLEEHDQIIKSKQKSLQSGKGQNIDCRSKGYDVNSSQGAVRKAPGKYSRSPPSYDASGTSLGSIASHQTSSSGSRRSSTQKSGSSRKSPSYQPSSSGQSSSHRQKGASSRKEANYDDEEDECPCPASSYAYKNRK